ncbi:MAG: epoxyqueuosine reductase QueH [Lachnospiraceae bacterium]|nr:epoxyqueuosine reductase QueH [Lachnospiraceae bacterium]
MNKVNYQKELDKITDAIDYDKRPTLLLHSCCAPCSSYCMEYLREFFDITVFYYNPNISSEPEYIKRLGEEKRLINEYNSQIDIYREKGTSEFPGGIKITPHTGYIRVIEGDYEPDVFYECVRGLEGCPEGGERCGKCFELRLSKTFELGKRLGFDYVTTTLTISPLKNAERINEIGYSLETGAPGDGSSHCVMSTDIESTRPRWLPSDFKKKEGYKRSIELSGTFDLYRQNYCGCVFSRNESEDRL